MADDISALSDIIPVSRETGARLDVYVALIRKWQRADNLIAPGTLPELWRRHIADSAQLAALFPTTRRWLDLGSGAGLPGLVVAILQADDPNAVVHLVESNRRKCAFLREVIRETGARAVVHDGRIESVLADWSAPVERISARALAPLGRLLDLASPLMLRGTPAAFHKGQDFVREIAEATQSWDFDLVEHASRVGVGGAILDITRLNPRRIDTVNKQ